MNWRKSARIEAVRRSPKEVLAAGRYLSGQHLVKPPPNAALFLPHISPRAARDSGRHCGGRHERRLDGCGSPPKRAHPASELRAPPRQAPSSFVASSSEADAGRSRSQARRNPPAPARRRRAGSSPQCRRTHLSPRARARGEARRAQPRLDADHGRRLRSGHADRSPLGHAMGGCPHGGTHGLGGHQRLRERRRGRSRHRGRSLPARPSGRAAFPGYDFVNEDADPSDDNGHGTGIAGIVAARAGNGLGGAGFCPRCSVMPVKVVSAAGWASDVDVAPGITWAVDHGANVINMSFGGTYSSTIASAIDYATARGVLVVAAAGNNGNSSSFYPAADAGVLSVAGTQSDDSLYPWSNYGPWVSVAAPGCDLTTIRKRAVRRVLRNLGQRAGGLRTSRPRHVVLAELLGGSRSSWPSPRVAGQWAA